MPFAERVEGTSGRRKKNLGPDVRRQRQVGLGFYRVSRPGVVTALTNHGSEIGPGRAIKIPSLAGFLCRIL